MPYISNNKRSIKTEIAEFMIEQRNVGFNNNDGRWIVSQLSENYWSDAGFLRQRRPGAFLGVFDTEADALAAIDAAEVQPITDQMVMSMGRVSC